MSSGENDEDVENSNHIRMLKIFILASVTCQGIYQYIPGPTLIDLVATVNQSLWTVLLIFYVRSTGHIIGIVLGSFMLQRLMLTSKKPLFLFITMIIMSASSFLIAMCTIFDIMLALFFLSGFGMGLLDTGVNAICLHSKSLHNNIFFCIISCFYGLGGFFSPVLATVFVKGNINATANSVNVHLTDSSLFFSTWKVSHLTSVSNAYVIIGILIFLVAIAWLVYYCLAIECSTTNEPQWDIKKNSVLLWNLTILNASALAFTGKIIEFGYSQMLPSYVVINFKRTQNESLEDLITFLGFFCLGRLSAIYLSKKTAPSVMLFVGIFLIFCGVLILYIDSQYERVVFLIANGVIGIGVGPIFINIYLWLCCKIFVTNRSMGPIFILESLAELIFPILLSKYVWTHPVNLKHFMLATATVIAMLYFLQYFLLYRVKMIDCERCSWKSSVVHQTPPLSVVAPTNAAGQTKMDNDPPFEFAISELNLIETVDNDTFFDHLTQLKNRITANNASVKSTLQELQCIEEN